MPSTLELILAFGNIVHHRIAGNEIQRFLLHRHDLKRSEEYLHTKSEFDRKKMLHQRMEILFYTKLLEAQVLFYRYSEKLYEEALDCLGEAEGIFKELNSLSSEFLYLSGKLTLHLIESSADRNREQLTSDLHRLDHIYNNTFLKYKYPNCDLAVKSLFSRYCYVFGEDEQFQSMNIEVQRRAGEYKDYPMFYCTHFYYVYSSICHTSKRNERNNSWLDILSLDDAIPISEMASDQSRVDSFYLRAIVLLWKGSYRKAIAELELARAYFGKLSLAASWIVEEVVILQMLLQACVGDLEAVIQQIKNYKRRKNRFDAYWGIEREDLNCISRSITVYGNANDPEELIRSFEQIRQRYGLLRLINIEQLLEKLVRLKA